MASIPPSLGTGIDTKQLVADLTAAARRPKEAVMAAREAKNRAQISTIGELSGGIDSFASSLNKLIKDGSLFTQPSSSDPSIAAMSAEPGFRLGELSARIEVVQLATAQSLASTNVADAAAPIGQGVLTLTTASGPVDITIGANNDSLNGLVTAINTANRGVTASIVKNSNGSRLVLRGVTGAANGFTLAAQNGAAPGLQQFTYDGVVSTGMTRAQTAQDALVKLDGIDVLRSSNSFSDLIPGVKMDLKKAAPGTIVTIGSARPTQQIKQAMQDFVAAYNALESSIDKATAPGLDGGAAGAMRGSGAMRDMRKQLADITSTVLRGGEGPTRLSEIGITTNRDGSLSLDSKRFDAVIAAHPDAVEGLFNPKPASTNPPIAAELGLGGAMQKIRDNLRGATGPLVTSEQRIEADSRALSRERAALETYFTTYSARLTSSFSGMNARLKILQETRSSLDNQIKQWTNSR